jgi:hypothetical protein
VRFTPAHLKPQQMQQSLAFLAPEPLAMSHSFTVLPRPSPEYLAPAQSAPSQLQSPPLFLLPALLVLEQLAPQQFQFLFLLPAYLLRVALELFAQSVQMVRLNPLRSKTTLSSLLA